ncbi:MAG: hypothetical protein LBC73_09455 [Oscillospiraceae bacterium]|jgi:hypothetical protein|nr:hypothetical protein [Oscillospiraceae bacterium]
MNKSIIPILFSIDENYVLYCGVAISSLIQHTSQDNEYEIYVFHIKLSEHFIHRLESILSDDGVWYIVQSYMPIMLRNNAYDTICHEHLEYYSLSVINYTLDISKLRIIDVSVNDINGGSIAITCCKENAPYKSNTVLIDMKPDYMVVFPWYFRNSILSRE